MVSNLRIFIVAPNFATRQIQRRWFQIWQYLFQIPVKKYANKPFFGKKYSNKGFLVLNLDILFFRKVLQLEKFEGADFKYDNSFSKVPTQKFPRIFIFAPNLARRQIRGRWFQIWKCYFHIPAPKYGNLEFFVSLHQTLQLDKLGGVDCKYDNSFQRSSPKTQIELFWSPVFFSFWIKVYSFTN